MSEVQVKKVSDEELNKLNINSWSTWECGISSFDWHYDEEEVCYFFEGEVVVETRAGNYEIKAGDLVTFSKGLSCKWHVKKTVRKKYKFN
jgi:hypothetical protein